MLSFALSLRILSRTIAGSTVVMLLMIRSVVSSPISGRGCRDRKSSGSASSFPDSYVNSKSTSYMSMTHFSMRGGSIVVSLLNRGSSGFWAVTTVNLGAPNRYMLNRSFAHLRQSASFSVWMHLFVVSVSLRLMKGTGCHPFPVFWNNAADNPSL